MKPSNKKKRLGGRIKDYSLLMEGKNPESSKKEQRKENGGYHKPGSFNK